MSDNKLNLSFNYDYARMPGYTVVSQASTVSPAPAALVAKADVTTNAVVAREASRVSVAAEGLGRFARYLGVGVACALPAIATFAAGVTASLGHVTAYGQPWAVIGGIAGMATGALLCYWQGAINTPSYGSDPRRHMWSMLGSSAIPLAMAGAGVLGGVILGDGWGILTGLGGAGLAFGAVESMRQVRAERNGIDD